MPLDIMDNNSIGQLTPKQMQDIIWQKAESHLNFRWGEFRRLQERGIIQWSDSYLQNYFSAFLNVETQRLWIYQKNLTNCHIRLTTLGVALNKLLKTTFEPFNSIEFYSKYFSDKSLASDYWKHYKAKKFQYHELVEVTDIPTKENEKEILKENGSYDLKVKSFQKR